MTALNPVIGSTRSSAEGGEGGEGGGDGVIGLFTAGAKYGKRNETRHM